MIKEIRYLKLKRIKKNDAIEDEATLIKQIDYQIGQFDKAAYINNIIAVKTYNSDDLKLSSQAI